MKLKDDARFSTICIHAGQEPDPATGAIITPIYQTSTYVQDGLGQPHAGFEYGRTQNPTRMALERNVAAIEAGTAAFAFASGMAAIDALLTRLESGDHVLVSDNTYGGTFRLFERVRRKFGLDFTYVDTSKPELVEPAIKPNTKYLFIETPTNPMLHITDIQCVSAIAHRKNVARRRRQHLCQPVHPAPADARRRHRAAQHDEVPQRPQRQRRRRRDPQAPGRCGLDEVRAERRRRDPRADGFVADPARHQDADRSAWSAPTRTRRSSPSISTAHPKVKRTIYPGLEVASASRAGEEADAAASAD